MKRFEPKRKSKTTAAILALFLGGIGAHHFYSGNTITGTIYFLFSWTFIPMVISFFEFLYLIFSSQDEYDRNQNKDWVDYKRHEYKQQKNSDQELRDQIQRLTELVEAK